MFIMRFKYIVNISRFVTKIRLLSQSTINFFLINNLTFSLSSRKTLKILLVVIEIFKVFDIIIIAFNIKTKILIYFSIKYLLLLITRTTIEEFIKRDIVYRKTNINLFLIKIIVLLKSTYKVEIFPLSYYIMLNIIFY